VGDAVSTPERILRAAEDVLRRSGPEKATVVDLARALGVAHAGVDALGQGYSSVCIPTLGAGARPRPAHTAWKAVPRGRPSCGTGFQPVRLAPSARESSGSSAW
jgi:hypothetical protein